MKTAQKYLADIISERSNSTVMKLDHVPFPIYLKNAEGEVEKVLNNMDELKEFYGEDIDLNYFKYWQEVKKEEHEKT